jgi:hypothetical protein
MKVIKIDEVPHLPFHFVVRRRRCRVPTLVPPPSPSSPLSLSFPPVERDDEDDDDDHEDEDVGAA